MEEDVNLPPLEDLLKEAGMGESSNDKKPTPSQKQERPLGDGEYICPLLERKEGNGRIFAKDGKVSCENYRISEGTDDSYCRRYTWQECKISKVACPYSDTLGHKEGNLNATRNAHRR